MNGFGYIKFVYLLNYSFLHFCWIITPDLYYSLANAYIYTIHMTIAFHLLPSLFGFLHNYSVYLFTKYIIPTDYIPTRNV